jgi:hypothetical protein
MVQAPIIRLGIFCFTFIVFQGVLLQKIFKDEGKDMKSSDISALVMSVLSAFNSAGGIIYDGLADRSTLRITEEEGLDLIEPRTATFGYQHVPEDMNEETQAEAIGRLTDEGLKLCDFNAETSAKIVQRLMDERLKLCDFDAVEEDFAIEEAQLNSREVYNHHAATGWGPLSMSENDAAMKKVTDLTGARDRRRLRLRRIELDLKAIGHQ